MFTKATKHQNKLKILLIKNMHLHSIHKFIHLLNVQVFIHKWFYQVLIKERHVFKGTTATIWIEIALRDTKKTKAEAARECWGRQTVQNWRASWQGHCILTQPQMNLTAETQSSQAGLQCIHKEVCHIDQLQPGDTCRSTLAWQTSTPRGHKRKEKGGEEIEDWRRQTIKLLSKSTSAMRNKHSSMQE